MLNLTFFKPLFISPTTCNLLYKKVASKMSQNQDEEMADATAGTERPEGRAEEDEEPVQRLIKIVRSDYSLLQSYNIEANEFQAT